MTWPAAQIMQTLCVHSLVKTTLRNKASFWAVTIGAPGIYQTEYVSIVYCMYSLIMLITNSTREAAKAAVKKFQHAHWGGGQDLH